MNDEQIRDEKQKNLTKKRNIKGKSAPDLRRYVEITFK